MSAGNHESDSDGYKALLQKKRRAAQIRDQQGGDVREEQILMWGLGHELTRAREDMGFSPELLAVQIISLSPQLFVTPDDIRLGEQGLLEPIEYFPILPTWARVLGVDEDSYINELNRSFNIVFDARYGMQSLPPKNK